MWTRRTRLRILFFDISTALTTVRDLETTGRGGMVASLFKVSDYLAGRGHDVTVLGGIETPGTTASGVRWFNRETFPWDERFDVLVMNRGTSDGLPRISARRRVLWTHDLPHNGMIPEPKTIKAFSATVFMSRYAEDIWRCFFRDIGRSFLIPNGVDRGMFYPREKDPNYLIFASAPNRGLKRLPFIFDATTTRLPNRPLYLRAFSNMVALHPHEERNEEQDGFALVYKDVADSSVDLRMPVPQHELAEELGRAGLMVMPTDYPEICSNVILQALASGTPVVTTGGIGSAGEWIRDGRNGRLTRHMPVDYMIHTVEMVRAIVETLEDERVHRRLIRGAVGTRVMTWDEVGAEWERMLRGLA